MNVEFLGQVFTPRFVVDKILSLRKNKGNCMEPSCGDGAISSMIEDVVAIEYDIDVCPSYALNIDFFDYDISNKFDSIIGNPPFVRFKDIYKSTKDKLDMKLFDKRCDKNFEADENENRSSKNGRAA